MRKGSYVAFGLAVVLCAVGCAFPTDGLAAVAFFAGFAMLLMLALWLAIAAGPVEQPRSAIEINTVARAAPGDMPPSRLPSPRAATGSGQRQPRKAA